MLSSAARRSNRWSSSPVIRPTQRSMTNNIIYRFVYVSFRPPGTGTLGSGVHSVGVVDTIPGWVSGSEKFVGLKARVAAALALVQFTIAVSLRHGPTRRSEKVAGR